MKVSESRLQLLPEFPKPSVQTKNEMKREGERSNTSPEKKKLAPTEVPASNSASWPDFSTIMSLLIFCWNRKGLVLSNEHQLESSRVGSAAVPHCTPRRQGIWGISLFLVKI